MAIDFLLEKGMMSSCRWCGKPMFITENELMYFADTSFSEYPVNCPDCNKTKKVPMEKINQCNSEQLIRISIRR